MCDSDDSSHLSQTLSSDMSELAARRGLNANSKYILT